MSIEQRRHTRFSIEVPADIITSHGERQPTVLQQISIGGCFTGWEENIFAGDEFRIELPLPNGNRLPLSCRAVYRFENTGVGVRFQDMTAFEESLVAKVIMAKLHAEGLPVDVDPLMQPAAMRSTHGRPPTIDDRREKDAILEQIMSGDEKI